ncbi:Uncharacterized protein BP5553_10042 [Venustampulla echinocandica]|uniref:Uncharacterized protein n=1 Tax=Venustampulla echinocandica TaxID=2656787 RepID=A0A370TA52_9HELO|nr:Uncharacterized protein BP5553_10042 [Venustampulla echinocandica]RDL30697.1 Uncharacterized protein BP5553_10042 [Venustampulla echinocandica]
MPPRLHPRSRLTSSLFATTVFASFFVVALPHALPCPAPRIAYADGQRPDGTAPRRRRRRKCEGEKSEPLKDKPSTEESSEDSEDTVETTMISKKHKRECPVPKPGGLVGNILGFQNSSSDGNSPPRPP